MKYTIQRVTDRDREKKRAKESKRKKHDNTKRQQQFSVDVITIINVENYFHFGLNFPWVFRVDPVNTDEVHGRLAEQQTRLFERV